MLILVAVQERYPGFGGETFMVLGVVLVILLLLLSFACQSLCRQAGIIARNRAGVCLRGICTLLLAVLVALASGCGRDKRADQPPGDLLPAPKVCKTRDEMTAVMVTGGKLARLYAAEKRIEVVRGWMPAIELFVAEQELWDAANREREAGQSIPELREGQRLWALTNLQRGKVYIDCRADHDTVYHECGHWFLGLDCNDADKFAAWALREQRGVDRLPVLTRE